MDEKKIISLFRKYLKENHIILSICEKYKEKNTDEIIDNVPIRFEPLDVSAKTVNGEIILNSELLKGDFRDNVRYLIHEFTHVLQQENGKVNSTTGKDENYLDDPNEIEAFQNQIDYMEEVYSEKEIQEYMDQLLDHHNIKGKERIKKTRELI